MGAVLTAELIAEAGNLARFRSADALAAAAGIAPVLRQSGKARFLRRPTGGNKGLKRVFYQSAFCSLGHPDSRAFYDRKRREGKRHHQAVIALARRRMNVLWAILHNRQPFQTRLQNRRLTHALGCRLGHLRSSVASIACPSRTTTGGVMPRPGSPARARRRSPARAAARSRRARRR